MRTDHNAVPQAERLSTRGLCTRITLRFGQGRFHQTASPCTWPFGSVSHRKSARIRPRTHENRRKNGRGSCDHKRRLPPPLVAFVVGRQGRDLGPSCPPAGICEDRKITVQNVLEIAYFFSAFAVCNNL